MYVTCDVLACSASILHMCCISLGRYLGIRSPLKARGYGGRGGGSFITGGSSKRLVIVRVVLVWILALLISSPISALGLMDPTNIMLGDQCVINNRGFAFFGSLAAFYVPMIIMVVSYALTVHLLRNKARQHQHQMMQRVVGGGGGSRTFGGSKRSFRSVNLSPNDGAAEMDGDGNGGGDNQVSVVQLTMEKGTQTPVSVSRERRLLMWKARISFMNKSSDPIRVVKSSAAAGADDAAAAGGSRSRKISRMSNLSSGSSIAAPRRSGSLISSSAGHPNISSAATVANEQKASKVLGVVFFT